MPRPGVRFWYESSKQRYNIGPDVKTSRQYIEMWSHITSHIIEEAKDTDNSPQFRGRVPSARCASRAGRSANRLLETGLPQASPSMLCFLQGWRVMRRERKRLLHRSIRIVLLWQAAKAKIVGGFAYPLYFRCGWNGRFRGGLPQCQNRSQDRCRSLFPPEILCR